LEKRGNLGVPIAEKPARLLWEKTLKRRGGGYKKREGKPEREGKGAAIKTLTPQTGRENGPNLTSRVRGKKGVSRGDRREKRGGEIAVQTTTAGDHFF